MGAVRRVECWDQKTHTQILLLTVVMGLIRVLFCGAVCREGRWQEQGLEIRQGEVSNPAFCCPFFVVVTETGGGNPVSFSGSST
jgi:hypothetical protein